MASVVLAIGIAIYVSAEKVHNSREKKRALKALEASEHGSIEERSSIDDIPHQLNKETLSDYHVENSPPYQMEDQHPALRNDKHDASY
jgi:hypothetical protein